MKPKIAGSLRTLRVMHIALMTLATAGGVRAPAQATGPAFDVDLHADRAPSSSQAQLTAYIRVPLASLSLVRANNGFVGRYDITAEVHRTNERGRRTELVRTQITRRDVPPVRDFAEARSDTVFDQTRLALGDVPAGHYEVEIRLEDAVTRRLSERTVEADVPSFSSLPALSSILLLERTGDDVYALRPNVANNFTTDQPQIVASFSAYVSRPVEARFSYDIHRLKGHGAKARPGDEPELSLSAEETRRLQRGENRVLSSIPTSDLRVGQYVLKARLVGSSGRVLAEAEKRFELRWSGLERQVRDLDEAVAQLAPIAKGKELEAMRGAANTDEKRRRFDAFWRKRDPTPRTPRNERMEEYYYRVWYADSRYSSPAESGWKSDRGKVYLRFGEPDRTDRYPINAREKFEVWTYEQFNRRFIFIDRSGDGRFVLFRPIWDERNRIR